MSDRQESPAAYSQHEQVVIDSVPDFPPPDVEAPLIVWEYVASLRRFAIRYQKALVRCVIASGADVGDGIPKWPTLDEWAVREVERLRADYDEVIHDA